MWFTATSGNLEEFPGVIDKQEEQGIENCIILNFGAMAKIWVCVLYIRYVYVYICFIAELFAKGEGHGRVHTKLLKWTTLDGRKCRGRIESSNGRKRKIALKTCSEFHLYFLMKVIKFEHICMKKLN